MSNFFTQQPGESSEEFQERIIAWKQESRGVDPTTLSKEERDEWVADHRSGRAGRVSETYRNWLEAKKHGLVDGSYDHHFPASSKPSVANVEYKWFSAKVTYSDGSVEWVSKEDARKLEE